MAGVISFGGVHAALSGLKACKADLGIGMDVVTDVAIDLVEAREGEDNEDIKTMEVKILECAKLDLEINTFISTVETAIAEIHQRPPEDIFRLSASVAEQFSEKVALLSDAGLQQHKRVLAFKNSVGSSARPGNSESADNMEEVDEDIAMSQNQVNFICPLTQLEMVKPVKNKKCGHYYDEAAILSMIKARHKQKKKFCCPIVGCVNKNVVKTDLVPDMRLKKIIQTQERGSKKS